MKEYYVACIDFAINRLLMYSMVYTFKEYRFLPRVVTSHMNYLKEIAATTDGSISGGLALVPPVSKL